MDRIERAKQKYAELFGEGQPVPYSTDADFQHTFPDFEAILSRFIFGEVFFQGSLTIQQRELITLVVMATNQTLPQLHAHVGAVMKVSITDLIVGFFVGILSKKRSRKQLMQNPTIKPPIKDSSSIGL